MWLSKTTGTVSSVNVKIKRMESKEIEEQSTHHDDQVAIVSRGDKKHKSKRGRKWVTNSIQSIAMVTLRSMSLIDLVTDIILLYKIVDELPIKPGWKPFITTITLILFVSILCPFFLCYSGTIKVLLFRQMFDNLSGIYKFIALLYIIPTSIGYVVFLDILDALFHVYGCILVVIFGSKKDEIKVEQENLVTKVGFDRMSWEGFKRQKSVSQCMICILHVTQQTTK